MNMLYLYLSYFQPSLSGHVVWLSHARQMLQAIRYAEAKCCVYTDQKRTLDKPPITLIQDLERMIQLLCFLVTQNTNLSTTSEAQLPCDTSCLTALSFAPIS